MLIFIPEPKEIHKDAIDLLKQRGHNIIYDFSNKNKKHIEAIFIRTYTHANKLFLDQFPNLRFILRAGVGLDNIDLVETEKRNIKVINSPGANANAVAEFVVGLIIMLLRNIPQQTNSLREGEWRKKELMGEEIKGKTLGIIGCGAIGKLIIKKLSGFELEKILGYDPYLNKKTLEKTGIIKVELHEILKKSDIVSLHLPLTEGTKNLISYKELTLMKKSSFLINTSRGGIVSENDLIKVLRERKIKGVALDVFENEPRIKREFLNLPNLISTPHLGGYTEEAEREISIAPAYVFINSFKVLR